MTKKTSSSLFRISTSVDFHLRTLDDPDGKNKLAWPRDVGRPPRGFFQLVKYFFTAIERGLVVQTIEVLKKGS